MVCFTNSTIETTRQELAVVKEKVDWLKYALEQEKSANATSVKETNFYEEVLHKAHHN